MEAGFINKLSAQALQEYAECEEIYAVSSYTKTDADGNVTNVTKEEAESAADTRAIVPAPDPGGGSYPSYETSFTDTYMHISYVVSYLGNGQYKFSVDSHWLSMPYFRGFDSLGACAQNMTVENDSRTGWISYECISSGYPYPPSDVEQELDDSLFKNAVNGNWYGSAATFVLPRDTTISDVIWLVNRNFRAHYEYVGAVIYPNQPMNFNTTASYCHTRVGISVDPNVSIATNGTSAAIAIALTIDKDIRTAEFGASIPYNQ